jgi:hypothetical protein
MPTATNLLSSLSRIANEQSSIAIGWHILIFAGVPAYFLAGRPSPRLWAVLLAGLPLSVTIVSFAYANPFNGASFAVLSLVLLAQAVVARPSMAPLLPGRTVLGVTLLAFGLVYPHFVGAASPAFYLIAAPVGLVPGPTLAALMGLTLLDRGLISRTWAVVLSLYGLFYFAVGVFRLGVWLDVGLLAGVVAVAAGVAALSSRAAVSSARAERATPSG